MRLTQVPRALDRILRAAHRDDAEERLRLLLHAAWKHGNQQGFEEGQADAILDDATKFPPNPYRERR